MRYRRLPASLLSMSAQFFETEKTRSIIHTASHQYCRSYTFGIPHLRKTKKADYYCFVLRRESLIISPIPAATCIGKSCALAGNHSDDHPRHQRGTSAQSPQRYILDQTQHTIILLSRVQDVTCEEALPIHKAVNPAEIGRGLAVLAGYS